MLYAIVMALCGLPRKMPGHIWGGPSQGQIIHHLCGFQQRHLDRFPCGLRNWVSMLMVIQQRSCRRQNDTGKEILTFVRMTPKGRQDDTEGSSG